MANNLRLIICRVKLTVIGQLANLKMNQFENGDRPVSSTALSSTK